VIRRIVLFLFITLLSILFGLLRGSFPMYLVFGLALGGYLALLDWQIEHYEFSRLLGGSLGSVLGIGISLYFLRTFFVTPLELNEPIVLTILGVGAYLGVYIGVQVADKWPDRSDVEQGERISPKLLDTSVIIDGRIAEVIEIGFIEGEFIVPRFILKELQNMADSGKKLKRNRGRRGLDILNKIRDDLPAPVRVVDMEFPDVPEVDAKLVECAKRLNGKVLTNDFNLNKVASLQGVEVLNINDLSNAVKPVYIPGESFETEVVKEGEEKQQGVGYLDDGTMVVIEEARDNVGETISVTVTSVIQTSAGRMIFAQKGETDDITEDQ
jgi:uncharacterized protein YacL